MDIEISFSSDEDYVFLISSGGWRVSAAEGDNTTSKNREYYFQMVCSLLLCSQPDYGRNRPVPVHKKQKA